LSQRAAHGTAAPIRHAAAAASLGTAGVQKRSGARKSQNQRPSKRMHSSVMQFRRTTITQLRGSLFD
jgi:hypothetical protein